MLPEPTIATLALVMNNLLLELQGYGSEPTELGAEVIARVRIDGAGAGAGQHDVTGLQPDAEAVDLLREPGDGGHRVAEHGVAAALGLGLTVARQDGVDGRDVDVRRPHPVLAEHETGGRRV